MEKLSDVIKKIKPCDMELPYIFVSYSSHDRERVWRDVLEFQKRGYNVWLDEKNLDKTKESWKEDALNAVEDMECSLLVYYISSASICSESCYQELARTVSKRTVALHRGPVKFIAIETEEIGDINQFAEQIFDKIQSSGESKAIRQSQALALDAVISEFFNSNNERVRIRLKDEENRKIDYYEEILSSFPEKARVYDEVKEDTVPVKEVKKVEEPVTIIPDIKQEKEQDLFTKKVACSEATFTDKKRLEKKVIPNLIDADGVCTIGEEYTKIESVLVGSVFGGNKNLRVVNLPDRMSVLPIRCFRGCEQLIEVQLPLYLTEVASGLFSGCRSLEQIEIPGNVTKIGAGAFENCHSLRSVKLPRHLKKIEGNAFKNCSFLTEIYLPPYLTEVDYSCFEGCTGIKEVVIPGKLKTIPLNMFDNCSKLEKVVIQPGVEKIDSAFQKCGEVLDIWIPDSVKKISSIAFSKTDNVTIHCSRDSVAYHYAVKRRYHYVVED